MARKPRGLAVLWRSSGRSRARRRNPRRGASPGRVRRVAWLPRSSGVGGSRPAERRPEPRRPRRARPRVSPSPGPRSSRPPTRKAASQASTRARLDGFLPRRYLGSLRRLRPRRGRRRPHSSRRTANTKWYRLHPWRRYTDSTRASDEVPDARKTTSTKTSARMTMSAATRWSCVKTSVATRPSHRSRGTSRTRPRAFIGVGDETRKT